MSVSTLLDELENPQETAEQMSFDQLIASSPPPGSHENTDAQGPVQHVTENSLPVTGRHQDVRLYLTVLMKTFVEMSDAGIVRESPFEVQLESGRVYCPDIVFVANNNFDRLHETHVYGPPDIVIEVLTPESTAQDRGEKFVAYEAAGVREYWLIDPLRQIADMYYLGPDRLYDEYRPDITGRLRSRVLKGFILDIDSLWQRVLPMTTEIVERAQAMISHR